MHPITNEAKIRSTELTKYDVTQHYASHHHGHRNVAVFLRALESAEGSWSAALATPRRLRYA